MCGRKLDHMALNSTTTEHLKKAVTKYFCSFLKHHDTIVTSKDVGLRVRCNYNLTDKTVTQSSDLQVDEGHSQAQLETTEVSNPNVTMRITDR